MLFNSGIFIFVFLPVVLLVFFLFGRLRGREPAMAWLTLASLFFYAWWNPLYLPLLLVSILANYACGWLLNRLPADRPVRKRAVLAAGIVFNLGLLGYFKYAAFFVRAVNGLAQQSWPAPAIVLPLAISFYTFQQLAYLVDAYRGATREHNFLHYTLFVTYYPQLIAGPIVHHKEVLPQFNDSQAFRYDARNMAVGLTVFALGLAKKTLIADNVSVYSTPVFNAAAAGGAVTLPEAWCGALAYAFQIYFDFSGYSDMAIGLGKMCGIDLPLNFNSPYKAGNIIEFWQRWHMTLSRFLRDYLYIPLGGNRRGKLRRYLNLMITMVLGGLWHGAGWTFVLWGTLHGLYLAVNHGWRYVVGRLPNRRWTEGVGPRWLARLITFLAVLAGWVLFRAAHLPAAGAMFRGLLGLNGMTATDRAVRLFHGAPEVAVLAALLAAIWLLPNTQKFMHAYLVPPDALRPTAAAAGPATALPRGLRWRPTAIWGAAISVLAACAFLRLSLSRITEFLYFQF
jgi:D-alanyl-lipoteichoic acid acyltransferase DltB (MBOAT superfamily)